MNDITLLLSNKQKAEKEGYQYCNFLVNMFGAFYTEGSVKMLLEYMDGGSLGDILR